MEAISWLKLLSVALPAGVVGGVVTKLLDFVLASWREARKEKAEIAREATYAAMRVAIILEEFTIACAAKVADVSWSEHPEGTPTRLELPTLREYPSDIDWHSLDTALTERVLALPNDLFVAKHGIDGMLDVAPEQAGDALIEHAAACGLKAFALAATLRERYRIAPASVTHGQWKFLKLLEEERDKFAERMARNAASLAG